MEPYTLTARWIFPVDQPPLAGGTVTLQHGRILAVEKAGIRRPDCDLGNTAILPGFVNAHSHLDLSDALGQCPPTPDFTAWLRAVIAHRGRQTAADVGKAIDLGLSQCLRYGTTLVGDIAARGASWQRLAQAPMRGVVFFELLGLTSDGAAKALAAAKDWLAQNPEAATCRPGLSPHAPYSVRHSLFASVAREIPQHMPISIHIAETAAEMELLRAHQGTFKDFLAALGVWDPAGLVNDPQQVFDSFKEREGALFVHGNYLPDGSDLGSGTLVHCPRTHAAFGHKPHPFRHFLARGNRVALGTDSLASNPDLDVLAEARFLHEKCPDVPGETVLKMTTLYGAKALTWEQEAGSLTPGKSADMVILALPNAEPADPHALILESTLPVQTVFFRGHVSHGAAASPPGIRNDREIAAGSC